MILVHRLGRGRPRQVCLVVLGSGLGGFALPGAAWAHHPGPGGGGPWTLLILLAFALGLGLIIALNFLEDRKARRSRKRRGGDP